MSKQMKKFQEFQLIGNVESTRGNGTLYFRPSELTKSDKVAISVLQQIDLDAFPLTPEFDGQAETQRQNMLKKRKH